MPDLLPMTDRTVLDILGRWNTGHLVWSLAAYGGTAAEEHAVQTFAFELMWAAGNMPNEPEDSRLRRATNMVVRRCNAFNDQQKLAGKDLASAFIRHDYWALMQSPWVQSRILLVGRDREPKIVLPSLDVRLDVADGSPAPLQALLRLLDP